MKFLSEDVRLKFHELPIERQLEWLSLAEVCEKNGNVLHICFVEQDKDALEVSVRIDKKFDR